MTENGKRRLVRAEKNEQAHKEHNERRAKLEEEAGYLQDDRVPFVCECDDPSCAHAVVMRLDEYEQAVEPPDQFVVLPGHEDRPWSASWNATTATSSCRNPTCKDASVAHPATRLAQTPKAPIGPRVPGSLLTLVARSDPPLVSGTTAA
jgi:hypothetical protein